MVLSCRHCYAQAESEMVDSNPSSTPSYMGMFVYGRACALQDMMAAVEKHEPISGVSNW